MSIFQLGTSYDMHLRNITSAGYTSQRKMPWELHLNTPWEVSKRLRGEKLFNLGVLPPIPGNRSEFNTVGSSGLGDASGDSFRSAGIALRSSSDTRLWQEKLGWERKAAYKKWTSLIAKQFNAWEICRQLWAGNSVKMAQGKPFGECDGCSWKQSNCNYSCEGITSDTNGASLRAVGL